MKYVIANQHKAFDTGFLSVGHRTDKIGKNILLNEKEVMNSIILSGDLDARASALGGKVYTENNVFTIISREDWSNE
jgi:hypothetical protein